MEENIWCFWKRLGMGGGGRGAHLWSHPPQISLRVGANVRWVHVSEAPLASVSEREGASHAAWDWCAAACSGLEPSSAFCFWMLFLCFCPHPASTLAGVDLLRLKLDALLYSICLFFRRGFPHSLHTRRFVGCCLRPPSPLPQSSPEGSMPVPASSPPELLSLLWQLPCSLLPQRLPWWPWSGIPPLFTCPSVTWAASPPYNSQ